jgi:hypothetical protein
MVVNPVAPAGKFATDPYPQLVSASATTEAACKYPLGASNSSLIFRMLFKYPGDRDTTSNPIKPGNLPLLLSFKSSTVTIFAGMTILEREQELYRKTNRSQAAPVIEMNSELQING